MIFLRLFLTFFEIGAVSFGGGYGMLALMRELTVGNGWLTEEEMLRFIAVSESTPGPIAVNMATFIGSAEGGILGAACATLGVVLPSFIIILIIASVLKNLMQYGAVQGVLSGIRPAVVGLILATAGTMLLSTFFGFTHIGDAFTPDFIGIAIFAAVAFVAFLWKKKTQKNPSAILLIVIAAALGAVGYSL